MKRFFMSVIAAVMAFSLAAQESQEQFKQKYDLLVSRLGVAGVGLETHIAKWEAAWPEDLEMLQAKFLYYFAKSRSTKVVSRPEKKFIGLEPLLNLPDSTGAQVYYFEEPFFEDSLFAKANQAIEKAVRLEPSQFDFRLANANALFAYEKGSPDMTLVYLSGMVDEFYGTSPAWVYSDAAVTGEVFNAFMMDYCFSFFQLSTPQGYEAFKSLSEKMLQYVPDSPEFTDNIGSYYLVYKGDTKKAVKYYDKVLKSHPDDLTAIRNCIIIARRDKNVKMEKKYLPMMVKYAESETDRLSAEGRLKALSKKK